MNDQARRQEFDRIALPHIDAAYNVARWLTRHDHDAEDVVQEAYLRAFQFFRGFQGDTGRAWLLQIVRNTCYTWQARKRPAAASPTDRKVLDEMVSPTLNPETQLERREDRRLLRQAIDSLPIEFREVIVLRELEELSYKDIARITEVPMGTVMSRLARARERLREILDHDAQGDQSHGMP